MANAASRRHIFFFFWPTVCFVNIMPAGRVFCCFTRTQAAIRRRRDRGMWEWGNRRVDWGGGGGLICGWG